MKALILGGTRFVGLRLVRFLAAQGHDLTLLNRGKTEATLPPGLKRLYADRRDGSALSAALKGKSFDAVFDMTGYQAVNIAPVVELLRGNIGHYVLQSTAGVYAESEFLPVTEECPYRPIIPGISGFAAYEQDKVGCEQLLLQAHRETGFPATVFRCPIIYGPENWMDDREGSLFVRLLLGRPVIVPGNGVTFHHFTYVDDLARAHAKVVGCKQALGQVYNIAGVQAVTTNGLLDIIERVVGREARRLYLEAHEVKQLKRSVFPFSQEKSSLLDIHKARDHFGFWPDHTMETGLAETYRWWTAERRPERVKFAPGKLGANVDFSYEDEIVHSRG